jgi:hypothetical protein
MSPIALTDAELAEVRQAALTVPLDLRGVFLQQLAEALAGKVLGTGIVHRIAYAIARDITWTAGRTAVEI